MKHLCKITAILLTVILAGSLLTACSKGNDFTCADVINRSEDQQKWLRFPQSSLVINPDAIGEGKEDSRDMTTIPLSFGVQDASGNVIATYDDAFFILEYSCANGLGSEVVKQISWDGCKGLSKVDNLSNGTTLAFTIPDGFDKEIQVRLTETMMIDYNDKNLFLSCNIAELPEGASLIFQPYIIDTTGRPLTFETWTAPGYYLLNLRSAAENVGVSPFFDEGNSMSVQLKTSTPGRYRITDFSIVRLGTGYQKAAKAASTEWAPYYMKSNIQYPNGSAVETTDFFLGANIIGRKITPKAAGDVGFAGKIYGTCSYDSNQNALTFDNGATKYAIFLKRKGTIEYYATYEDLMSGENVLESPEGAAYWALLVNSLAPSEDDTASFYVAVAASDTLSMKELLDVGGSSISVTKAKKVYSSLEAYWDSFIAENDVSDYITVIPETKK